MKTAVAIEFVSTVQKNVLESRKKEETYLKADKLLAYIDYRNAREKLRKHVEFSDKIKTDGIGALL